MCDCSVAADAVIYSCRGVRGGKNTSHIQWQGSRDYSSGWALGSLQTEFYILSISSVLSLLVLLQYIQELFKKLCHAFLIFPQFNFGNGLMKLARMNIEVQLLSGYGIDAYKNPFSTEALGWMLISSFIQGLVFFTIRLLINRFLIRKVRWGEQKPQMVWWW